jgi:hypothetical protein
MKFETAIPRADLLAWHPDHAHLPSSPRPGGVVAVGMMEVFGQKIPTKRMLATWFNRRGGPPRFTNVGHVN